MPTTPPASSYSSLENRYRIAVGLFLAGLVLSGLTAFPLLTEIHVLCRLLGIDQTAALAHGSGFDHWLARVRAGLEANARDYPFLAYGTDLLAFGHICIAVFFIRPIFKPLESDWVLRCGLVCCAGVIPLALIAGPIRGLPFYWCLIDCSFGVIGALPLLYGLKLTRQMRQVSPQV